MRLRQAMPALLLLAILATASATLAAPASQPLGSAAVTQVIFPVGTVLHVTNFSALARFTVQPPDAQFVGAFHADHQLWIMAWTNGTPMPLCPIYQGYVGGPMNASYNETLKPETYTFGEVCGGFGNLTVTSPIELVYGSASGGNGSGGNGGGSGAGTEGGTTFGLGTLASVRTPAAVPLPAAALVVAAVGLALRGSSLPRSRRPPRAP